MHSCTIAIAVDSYKGSATSREAGELIASGIRRILPDARTCVCPIADGGEGTVDAILAAEQAEEIVCAVEDPLGRTAYARYAWLEGATALIEMAEAAGIGYTRQTADDALAASTYGLGQLILDALSRGARKIQVGLGGSATTDGGKGMAEALGVRFLDEEGREAAPGLAGLEHLASIDISGLDPRVRRTAFEALCDVRNPLCGPSGTVAVFGPQKGIPEARVEELDGWMRRYGALLAKACGRDVAESAGAGAAGGLGAALMGFCGATMVPGIDAVLDALGFDACLEEAALVVTGEGRMDAQTADGKAPVGVARRAKAHGVPTIAVVGACEGNLGAVYDAGIDLVLSCTTEPATLAACIARTPTALPEAGERVARVLELMERGIRHTEGADTEARPIERTPMNDIERCIRTRRSAQAFSSRPVPRDLAERVIEAGLWAPSGRNRQASIVLAIDDPTLIEELKRDNRALMQAPESYDPFYGAPMVLVVLADRTVETAIYDGSVAIENMLLAASSLGLGARWIHRAKEEFEMPRYQELLARCGVEGSYEGIGHVVLGYEEGAPKPAPERRPGRVFWA